MKLFSFDGKEKVNQRVHLCYNPAPGHCPAPYAPSFTRKGALGVTIPLYCVAW